MATRRPRRSRRPSRPLLGLRAMAVAVLFEAAIVFLGPSTSITPATAAIDPIGGQNITIYDLQQIQRRF